MFKKSTLIPYLIEFSVQCFLDYKTSLLLELKTSYYQPYLSSKCDSFQFGLALGVEKPLCCSADEYLSEGD